MAKLIVGSVQLYSALSLHCSRRTKTTEKVTDRAKLQSHLYGLVRRIKKSQGTKLRYDVKALKIHKTLLD